MTLYRDFRSREEIDAEYDPARNISDGIDWLAWYREQSRRARQHMDMVPNLSYGPTLDERVDLFPASLASAPLLVFFHGGYWRWGTSSDFSFAALGPHAAGFSVAVANYSLCPRVPLNEIIRQGRALIAWLWRHGDAYHGDRDCILVAGHSAGAQIAAMLAATAWERDYGLPGNLIRSVAAISGIYDLRPLRHSFLQPTLMLDHAQTYQLSPCCHVPTAGPSMLVSVGSLESEEFRRQALEYADSWADAGLAGSFLLQREKHHFSTIDGLLEPQSELCRSLVALVS